MDDHKIIADSNTPVMTDPLAYFITWPTYGTWLPGDKRGWIEYQDGWKLPQTKLELECSSRTNDTACRLNHKERQIVEEQAQETCEHRGWILIAISCRSNHAHLVISAFETDPKMIRKSIKAWCTRRLKERSDPTREKWWAERGSIRWVWNSSSLDTVVCYVNDAQDRKCHSET